MLNPLILQTKDSRTAYIQLLLLFTGWKSSAWPLLLLLQRKKKKRFRENVESKVTPERTAVDGEEEQTT